MGAAYGNENDSHPAGNKKGKRWGLPFLPDYVKQP
jgi:hypothetical protein